MVIKLKLVKIFNKIIEIMTRKTSWAVQFCLTSGLLSTKSMVIKLKLVKIFNKIIEIMTRKSDKK